MSMTSTKRTAVLLVLGLAALGAGPPVRPIAPASDDAKMFPDGRHYDFGTVKSGTLPRHTFRIVNRSDVPLQLISVRTG